MTDETLNALKASIARYERLKTAAKGDILNEVLDARACPLCKIHLRQGECNDCPINKAGFPGCEGTPWAISDHPEFGSLTLYELRSWLVGRYWLTPLKLKLVLRHVRNRCRKEEKFLKSLLPDAG